MPKPRVLDGQSIVKIFVSFGFSVVGQQGSHIKLRRIALDGSRETLTVPDHHELDRGTVVSLYRQGSRYIPEIDLRPHFYTN